MYGKKNTKAVSVLQTHTEIQMYEKNTKVVCLTDPHRNTNVCKKHKAVSVLQTHTEIQMYEKRHS
jgi:hypothetical protein